MCYFKDPRITFGPGHYHSVRNHCSLRLVYFVSFNFNEHLYLRVNAKGIYLLLYPITLNNLSFSSRDLFLV